MFFLSNVGMMASGAGFQGISPGYFPTLLGICAHHHLLVLFTRAVTSLAPNVLFFIRLLFRIISGGMAGYTFGFVFLILDERGRLRRHGRPSPDADLFLVKVFVTPDARFGADIGRFFLDEESL